MRAATYTTLLVTLFCYQMAGATFGKVVVIGGHASDLALDESRGQLYIANFTGRRIDVMSTADYTLQTPIPMTGQGESGSIALSPDNHYLLVTNYDDCTATNGCAFLTGGNAPTLTIVDLNSGGQTVFAVPQPPAVSPATTPPFKRVPLSIAFGQGQQAFLVTSNGFYLVDPAAGRFTPLPNPSIALSSSAITGTVGGPVLFGTFPPQIIQASTGISGDGQTIYVLAQVTSPTSIPTTQALVSYSVPFQTLNASYLITSAPVLGPRDVSVNIDGSSVLAGWALLNQQVIMMAEFPYPTGALNIGGHAWDYSRNLIYAEIPTNTTGLPPVLHIVDTDNLTVRERIQLPENLAGRSIFSSDMNTLYAISDSGVTVFRLDSFQTAHRVSTAQEQLLFQATSCGNGLITQTLDVIDLGGGRTDFSLSVPSGTRGVSFSQTSGTTPAKVIVAIDPTAYQSLTGTTVVPVTIQSNGSVGIPNTVALKINTKDPDQRGVIHGLPGTIVDLATDQARSRIYALRQDRNQVVVMDATSFSQVAILRTGNTPTKMTMTRDGNYMIVANDNSQIANVFDLNTLQPTKFIVFPFGHYPESIAAGNNTMLAVSRNAGIPPGVIDQVDFLNRVATNPSTLGIFTNSVAVDSVMTTSPSGNSIFTAMADGTVLLYDDTYSAFEAARKDLTALAGTYTAVSDDEFLAGGILFNRSMVQIGPLNTATAASSVLISGTDFLTVNADSPAAPALVQRASTLTTAVRPVRAIEAPLTKAILTAPPIGQIGQYFSGFLNTIAPSVNGGVLYLSISGFVELPTGFDLPTPVPSVTALVNTADGGPAAPGSLIRISGVGLAPTSASAGSPPLPTTLGEVCATVNSVAVPLIQVSPSEIDAQLPYEVSGPVNLVITAPGGKSAPFSFTAPATAAAVFRNGQAGSFTSLPLIYRASNHQLVDFTNPIHPNDTLTIVATGLGQTSPAAVTGAAAPSSPLEEAAAVPTVFLGPAPLSVEFAGLVPGSVGVYQINVAVPHSVRSGSQVPLTIQQGASTTTFTVRVVNP